MGSKESHRDYLNNLKNRIFKILPLCEEKNQEVIKHIDSIIFEIGGVFAVIPSAKESVWHIRVTSVLTNMSDNYSIHQLHDEAIYRGIIRREIFNLLSIIDREIDDL